MEGAFVYWVGWFIWVVGTFFLPKNQQRILLCICVLALLSFLPWKISYDSWSVSLGYIFILGVCYLFLRTLPFRQLIHIWFVTFCITGTYVGISALLRSDPVLLFIDFSYIVAICVLIVSFLFVRDPITRLYSVSVGLLHGEAVQAYIIGQQGYIYTVGSFTFFDIWALCLVSTASLSFAIYLLERLKQSVLPEVRSQSPEFGIKVNS